MQIYISKNNRQLGPFDENKVSEMLRAGQVSPQDMAIRSGDRAWQPLYVLFPQKVGAVSSPPIPATNQPKSAVGNSKGGNGLAFVLLGIVGVIFLLGIGGIAILFYLRSNTNRSLTVYDSNSATSTPMPSPETTPDLYKQDSDRRETFGSYEAEFTKLPSKVQLTGKPYIKGKVAFYNRDVEIGETDPVWLLDNDFASTSSFDEKVKDIKAKTPGEVQTVVIRKCTQYKKGNYIVSSRTIPGYAWKCDVSIVDRTISAVIFKKSFAGTLEKELSVPVGATEVEGYIPYEEISDFVGKLPRQ